MPTDKEIKKIMSKTVFKGMHPKFFEMLWRRFSAIQCASWILPNEDAKKRFIVWLKTGNDNELSSDMRPEEEDDNGKEYSDGAWAKGWEERSGRSSILSDMIMPPCSGADIVNKKCKYGLKKQSDRGWVTCFGYNGYVSNEIALTPPCVEEA